MEGHTMRQRPGTIDIRIKRFMAQKIAEYPELKEKYGPRVEVVQRGYLWEDIASFFSRKAIDNGGSLWI